MSDIEEAILKDWNSLSIGDKLHLLFMAPPLGAYLVALVFYIKLMRAMNQLFWSPLL
jgi:hypothetical protein